MLRHVIFYNTVAALINGCKLIKSVDDVLFLDNDRVTNLCRDISHPRGTDVNNNPDPSQKILLKSEESLNLLVYYVKHQDQVYRDVTVAQINLTSI